MNVNKQYDWKKKLVEGMCRRQGGGFLLAAVAAATYGTNPALAIPLYDDGMNPMSVLLFRYGLCLPILALMALWRRRSLRLYRSEIAPVCTLGVLMGISSLTLFQSYEYMNAGVASTLLFIYPVLVAVLMSCFFHERFRATTGLCLVLMGIGLYTLLKPGEGMTLSLTGCLLVFISALTYAIYIIFTNVSKRVSRIPTLKLLFYQFMSGGMVFVAGFVCGTPFTLPVAGWSWLNIVALAVLPSVVSLWCTTRAIHLVGATPTAIFGALEPVTAVVLSVFLLGQPLSPHEIAGGLLIVVATTLVVVAEPVDTLLLRIRRLFPSLRHRD